MQNKLVSECYSSIWLWTECGLLTRANQLVTNTQWIVSKVLVKYWQSIDDLKAISAGIHIDQYIDQLSTNCLNWKYIDISVDVSVEITYTKYDPQIPVIEENFVLG